MFNKLFNNKKNSWKKLDLHNQCFDDISGGKEKSESVRTLLICPMLQ